MSAISERGIRRRDMTDTPIDGGYGFEIDKGDARWNPQRVGEAFCAAVTAVHRHQRMSEQVVRDGEATTTVIADRAGMPARVGATTYMAYLAGEAGKARDVIDRHGGAEAVAAFFASVMQDVGQIAPVQQLSASPGR